MPDTAHFQALEYFQTKSVVTGLLEPAERVRQRACQTLLRISRGDAAASIREQRDAYWDKIGD
jgi:hypothetical protein